jgi:hypothetical protein
MPNKINMKKEKLIELGKKGLQYIVVGGLIVISFFAGKKSDTYPLKEHPNPYSYAFSPKEISIAVNESNELLLIEKKTGKYIVYSDEIGQTIFKMYTNRIYNKINE